MKKSSFWLIYLLLVIAQLILGNYACFTPYVLVTLLPIMVLCIPLQMGTVGAMLVAFVTGLAVDFLTEAVPGLNALALVPVAFSRRWVVGLVFGGELFARKEDFSVRRNGLGKVLTACALSTALFLVVYVWADAAGTRPFLFNLARFGASLPVNLLLSLLVLEYLAPDSRK